MIFSVNTKEIYEMIADIPISFKPTF